MKKTFKAPNFTGTMMGFVPYRDMERALRVILDNFPEAPCLPVMTRSIKWMLEGIPCVVIDRKKRQILLDPSPEREHELIEFYDRYEQQDLDYFATTEETAPFFYAMIEKLKKERPSQLEWVVFHSAGPVLLGDVLKQLDGKPSYYHDMLKDVLIKGVNMKTRWLEQKIKAEISDVEVVADLPETTLVSFTSAGGSGTRQDIISAINQGFSELTCLTWIHCCANIDWSLLTDTITDVINFDAYQHADKVVLYAGEFKRFLERGGMIGWGIVPVTEEFLLKESVSSLVEKLEAQIDLFVQAGIDENLLVSASWVLPCCDAILLTPDQTDQAFKMTRQISHTMKMKYGMAL